MDETALLRICVIRRCGRMRLNCLRSSSRKMLALKAMPRSLSEWEKTLCWASFFIIMIIITIFDAVVIRVIQRRLYGTTAALLCAHLVYNRIEKYVSLIKRLKLSTYWNSVNHSTVLSLQQFYLKIPADWFPLPSLFPN